ncbi:MAG: hypothetical protein ACI80N_002896, partial [Gammaproteobacteria bacterium]
MRALVGVPTRELPGYSMIGRAEKARIAIRWATLPA